MAIENWKLWLVPFGAWGLVMAWYSGYQSGYGDGHQTAWEMSRPSVVLNANAESLVNQDSFNAGAHFDRR